MQVGEEGTATEATDQSKSITIPATPILRNGNPKDVECTLGAIGIALNGVSIYGGKYCQYFSPEVHR